MSTETSKQTKQPIINPQCSSGGPSWCSLAVCKVIANHIRGLVCFVYLCHAFFPQEAGEAGNSSMLSDSQGRIFLYLFLLLFSGFMPSFRGYSSLHSCCWSTCGNRSKRNAVFLPDYVQRTRLNVTKLSWWQNRTPGPHVYTRWKWKEIDSVHRAFQTAPPPKKRSLYRTLVLFPRKAGFSGMTVIKAKFWNGLDVLCAFSL